MSIFISGLVDHDSQLDKCMMRVVNRVVMTHCYHFESHIDPIFAVKFGVNRAKVSVNLAISNVRVIVTPSTYGNLNLFTTLLVLSTPKVPS